MSIFGDLDIANAQDDPFSVAPGTYPATVSDVEVKDNKDKTLKGLWITYTVQGEQETGKKVTEWKTIPSPVDPKNPSAQDQRDMSFLKMRLKSLGVPETRMNTLQPEDLVGTDVVITVKKNGGYTNITKVEIYTGSDLSDAVSDGDLTNPFMTEEPPF